MSNGYRQKVPADELNASIAYSEEWKAMEDHVQEIENMCAVCCFYTCSRS